MNYGQKTSSTIDYFTNLLNEMLIFIPEVEAELTLFPNGKIENALQELTPERKFFAMRDKNNQLYFLSHSLEYDKNSELYFSTIEGYDILTESELKKLKLDSRNLPPVGIGSTDGVQLTSLGFLYLVRNSSIFTGINGKKFGYNQHLVKGDEYPDAIISMIKTEPHARHRGLAKNLLDVEEHIIASFNRGKRNCIVMGQINSIENPGSPQYNLQLEQFYSKMGYDIVSKMEDVTFPNGFTMKKQGRYFRKQIDLESQKNSNSPYEELLS